MDWNLEVVKENNKEAKWLSDLKEKMGKLEQQNVVINEDKVKKQYSKMLNWKEPDRDGVQGFWIKGVDKMHKIIITQLNKLLKETKEIPFWMTYGRTVLCQEDPVKRSSVENFRAISCLPLIRKSLTGMISEGVYYFIENKNLLSEEQKGYRKKTTGTKNKLLIDKIVIKYYRKRRTNLAMMWKDYRKAYDFVSHSWILECLDLLGTVDNVKKFLEESMK